MGTIVVQIAKNIIGASKVIAIAGTDEKLAYLKTVGADITVYVTIASAAIRAITEYSAR